MALASAKVFMKNGFLIKSGDFIVFIQKSLIRQAKPGFFSPENRLKRKRKNPKNRLKTMIHLTSEEVRVLGCLIEKQMATPDYYPMTLNSLQAACNQTSSREPVVSYETTTVDAALTGLRQKKLASMLHLAGSRAPKFRHDLEVYFPGLTDRERAILAVLLLRGPQSLAEISTRTERLFHFSGPEAVTASLEKLQQDQEGALVKVFPVGSGRRVVTYAHCLSGEPAEPTASASASAPSIAIPPPPNWADELATVKAGLEAEIAALRERLEKLEKSLGV
jgi:uncharacterized protein